MRLREWILLLSLSILWDGSFFLATVALAEIDPFSVAFARVALAALALNIAAGFLGQGLWRPGAPWPAFFAMGALNNLVPFSLIFWGPDPHRLRPRLDPERDNAALHSRGRPFPHDR